jgi:hypothetical protein
MLVLQKLEHNSCRALPDVEGHVLIFCSFLPYHRSIDVYREILAQEFSCLAKPGICDTKVEVLESRKEVLIGGRTCIQRDIVILGEVIDMCEMMYDKIKTSSRKEPGVDLGIELRAKSAHMDFS